MYNLLMKELKLGVSPIFYILPFLTGALMLIPGWLYFIVLLYFCFITVPNMLGVNKSQNDLIFSMMMPVSKKDFVKAKVGVIVILELLHIIIAVVFGMISTRLYPNLTYYFFGPTIGFWGLCFVMFAIFNIILISMYFKTAYKYGIATVVSTIFAILFAVGAEWLGLANQTVFDLFKGTEANNMVLQISILIAGVVIFTIFTILAYSIARKRFEKVEI